MNSEDAYMFTSLLRYQWTCYVCLFELSETAFYAERAIGNVKEREAFNFQHYFFLLPVNCIFNLRFAFHMPQVNHKIYHGMFFLGLTWDYELKHGRWPRKS